MKYYKDKDYNYSAINIYHHKKQEITFGYNF